VVVKSTADDETALLSCATRSYVVPDNWLTEIFATVLCYLTGPLVIDRISSNPGEISNPSAGIEGNSAKRSRC
jgi:hypothetical protein